MRAVPPEALPGGLEQFGQGWCMSRHRHPGVAGPANTLEAHLAKIASQLDDRLLCLMPRNPFLWDSKVAISVLTQRRDVTDDQATATAQQVHHFSGCQKSDF